MSDFRVSVHMHQFFQDHRSSSRLYITSKIKTVQDLQDHISKVFELNADFYLISNQLYLPSSENIRVLKEDDVITAVLHNPDLSLDCVRAPLRGAKKKHTLKPCTASQPETLPGESAATPIQCTEDSNGLKPKKRKRIKDLDPEIDMDTSCRSRPNLETCAATEKEKKKKISGKKADTNEDNTVVSSMVGQNETRSKKIDVPCEEDVFNISGCRKICSPSPVAAQPKITLDKDDLAREIRTSKRKNIELMKISPIPKIVKSVVVVDSPLAYFNNRESSSRSVAQNTKVDCPNENIDRKCKNLAVSSIIPTKVLLARRNEGGNAQVTPNQGRFQPFSSDYFAKDWESSRKFRNELIDDGQSVEPIPRTNIAVDKPDCGLENTEDTSAKMETNEDDNPPTVTQTVELNDRKINIISVEPIINRPTNEPLPNQGNLRVETQIANPPVMLENTEIVNENDNTVKQITIPNNSSNGKFKLIEDLIDDLHSLPTNPVGSLNTPPESYSSMATEESGVEVASTKRKRKRVRKRKPTSNRHLPDTPMPIQIKPSFVTAAPVTHIRFDEENEDDGIDANKPVDVVEVDLNYEKFCKEELVNFPIMKNRLPKQDDVICFKMVVISECYTPEISDFMIAKVLKYSSITNYVSLRIIEGAEQCCLPEGKFSIEECDEQNVELEKEVLWGELIEPRLLFP